jgi:3-oxoacyl-[acyl-carrier-protein] synthase-3
MPKACFDNARIDGVSVTLGPLLKKIDDESQLFGGTAAQLEKIKKAIGLNERRVVHTGTTAADLCEHASESLFKDLGVDRGSIDAVVCVTQTPDHFQPCNAAILHGKLGLSDSCLAFDISLGCSGWVVGLYVASTMLESGGCDKVLLLAGDTMSRCVNPRDRSVAPLFGDAGSATLLTRNRCRSWFSLHTDGKRSKFISIPAGGFRERSTAETRVEKVDPDGSVRSAEDLFMNGAEVFNFSIREEPLAVNEILNYSGVSKEQVDFFVFHQANKYIINNIARRLLLPLSKVPSSTVERYGNQSSASIPCTICDVLGVEAISGELTLLFSGFGVGLSWASCIMEQIPPFHTRLLTLDA